MLMPINFSYSSLFSHSKKSESIKNAISLVPLFDSDSYNSAKQISYSFDECIFGKLIIASTELGICYIHFYDDKNTIISSLKKHFSDFEIIEQKQEIHNLALDYIVNPNELHESLTLHTKGTEFQFAVWNCLLSIPFAETTIYNDIARILNKPNSARAVGGAIGSNPIAIIIPCHRVVQSSGKLGGYMWGLERKKAILKYEGEKLSI